MNWKAPVAQVRPRKLQRMPLVAGVPSFRPVVDSDGLLAVLWGRCRSLGRCSRTTRLGRWRSYGSIRPALKHGPRSLTCARVFGWAKLQGAMKVKAAPCRRGEIRSPFGWGRPILPLGRFEWERVCWDPKDGELCLNSVKPEETLMEVRCDYDVQIVSRRLDDGI